jgi:hypothetical protein
MLALIILFVFLVDSSLQCVRTQIDFLAEVRRVARSNIDYIMLCDYRAGIASNLCETFDRTNSERFGKVIEYLVQAEWKSEPGKSPRLSERMMKIRLRESSGEPGYRCYRMVRYVGFDEDYLSRIETDRECTQFLQFRPGSVAIHRIDAGQQEK